MGGACDAPGQFLKTSIFGVMNCDFRISCFSVSFTFALIVGFGFAAHFELKAAELLLHVPNGLAIHRRDLRILRLSEREYLRFVALAVDDHSGQFDCSFGQVKWGRDQPVWTTVIRAHE